MHMWSFLFSYYVDQDGYFLEFFDIIIIALSEEINLEHSSIWMRSKYRKCDSINCWESGIYSAKTNRRVECQSHSHWFMQWYVIIKTHLDTF